MGLKLNIGIGTARENKHRGVPVSWRVRRNGMSSGMGRNCVAVPNAWPKSIPMMPPLQAQSAQVACPQMCMHAQSVMSVFAVIPSFAWLVVLFVDKYYLLRAYLFISKRKFSK